MQGVSTGTNSTGPDTRALNCRCMRGLQFCKHENRTKLVLKGYRKMKLEGKEMRFFLKAWRFCLKTQLFYLKMADR